MNIKELQSFCSAAQFGSFSRAAKSLKVAVPTVTKHIRKLEADLGQDLFRRDQRPVQLTTAGASLLQIAAPMISDLSRLVDQGRRSAPVSPVIVACAHGFTNEMLLLAVRTFSERVPQCPIRIRVGTKPEVLAMVVAGSVDLAIVPNPDNLRDLAFQPIVASERVVITPRDHPLLARPLESLSELANYPLILLGYRTHTRKLLEEAFEEQGLSYEVAIELDSMDMVKRYVEIGLGIGVAHRAALDPEDLVHLGVVPIGAFLPSELVGIVTRKEGQLSGYARDFASVLSLTLRRSEISKPATPSLKKSRSQR